jgi:hypothetical protein
MTQLNFLPTSDFTKKYIDYIVAVILLLIVLFQCEWQTEHSGAIAQRDKDNVKANKRIDSLMISNKDKDKLIDSFKKKVAESDIAIHDINEKLVNARNIGNKQIAKMKDYELADWQKYYQTRTGYSDKDITLTNNTLNMTKPPLAFIASQIVKYDVCKYEVNAKNNVIFQKDTIIFQKDKIIRVEKEKYVNLLRVKGQDSLIIGNLNKNVSDLKTDLKKANRLKIKPIIISAVLGGIAGAYLNNK